MKEQIRKIIEDMYLVEYECECEHCAKSVVVTQNLVQWDYLLQAIWKEAQKEILEELKRDFSEGNPAEEICMKFIDKLDKLEVDKEE